MQQLDPPYFEKQFQSSLKVTRSHKVTRWKSSFLEIITPISSNRSSIRVILNRFDTTVIRMLSKLRKQDLSDMRLDAASKKILAEKVVIDGKKPKDIANDFNIPVDRVRNYAQMHREGRSFSDNYGRIPVIDKQSGHELVQKLPGPIATRIEDVKGLMYQAAKETKIHQGLSASLAKVPSYTTRLNFMRQNHLVKKNVEEVTDARYEA